LALQPFLKRTVSESTRLLLTQDQTGICCQNCHPTSCSASRGH